MLQSNYLNRLITQYFKISNQLAYFIGFSLFPCNFDVLGAEDAHLSQQTGFCRFLRIAFMFCYCYWFVRVLATLLISKRFDVS